MKSALTAFFKRPTTFIGIATAVLFQVVFSVVWMTGYDGITDRMDRLHVAVVNEDAGFGAQVAQQLKSTLPVQVETAVSLEIAQQRLDERKLQMIIRIPAGFSERAAAPDNTAAISYIINESNPALIKSMMTSIAADVTAAVNKQAISAGAGSMLGQLNVPAEQTTVISGALAERVTSDIQSVNPVDGINNQMLPMMMVLASYVGAMIMGMNLEQSSMAIRAQSGRWQRFGARTLINLAAAVVVSLVGTSLVMALGGQSEQSFIALWGFEALFILTFMFVSQLFLILFGMAGMLFNILLLSAQLVSSGAMMPRELLSDFYANLSNVFPATYAVEGSMNLLFGGPATLHPTVGLLLILGAAVLVSVIVIALRKDSAVLPAAVPAAQM
jgi:YhgE/Pip-like protein